MANDVFANGREVSCKAADGKSICALPDVCMTPPENPATPPGVPVPYPNTGMAKDTTSGSKKVKISKKEVLLKNKSYFKKSMGDEAGCAAKKGVITSKNRGKVYFNAWSMDVKFEGKNVVRHLDITTHNHASVPGNTPTWPYIDSQAWADPGHPCIDEAMDEYEACKDYTPHGSKDACAELGSSKPARTKASAEAPAMGTIAALNKCLSKRKCMLQPYDPSGCCYPQTPHHIIEASSVAKVSPHHCKKADLNFVSGIQDYDHGKAPCVCAEGTTQNVGTHGQMHTFQREGVDRAIASGDIVKEHIPCATGTTHDYATTYGDSKKNGIAAMKKTFPESDCKEGCLEAQLDAYHEQCNMNDNTKIKAVREGSPDVDAAVEKQIDRSHTVYLESSRGR